MQEAKNKRLPVILMGDFNGHIRGWTSDLTNTNGQALIDFANYWQLEILPNNTATFTGRHGQETCTDYVLIPYNAGIETKGHSAWKT